MLKDIPNPQVLSLLYARTYPTIVSRNSSHKFHHRRKLSKLKQFHLCASRDERTKIRCLKSPANFVINTSTKTALTLANCRWSLARVCLSFSSVLWATSNASSSSAILLSNLSWNTMIYFYFRWLIISPSSFRRNWTREVCGYRYRLPLRLISRLRDIWRDTLKLIETELTGWE